jgi:hypothetical protein
VIAKLKEFVNVVMDQPLQQPDAETTKLLHAKEDVHLLNHLFHHQQIHVIVKDKQFVNVVMDQLLPQLLAETTKLQDAI